MKNTPVKMAASMPINAPSITSDGQWAPMDMRDKEIAIAAIHTGIRYFLYNIPILINAATPTAACPDGMELNAHSLCMG